MRNNRNGSAYTTTRQDQEAEEDGQMSDFEALLDRHEPERPHRGQIVRGEILKLEENMAIIDVGAKRDAIVPPHEMMKVDESLLESLNEGDVVPVYINQTPVGDDELHVSLEKGQRELDWQRAEEMMANDEAEELEIVHYNKGGILVKFGRLQGFVPNSHIPALDRIFNRQEMTKSKADLIGDKIALKIIELDRLRKRLVLSAKEAREERRLEQLEELEEGQVVKGRVKNIVPYGAFVSLGAVTGLLHISEMSWQHVEHLDDLLEPGEEIEVVVKNIDVEEQRVSLSRKDLLPSPWDEFAEQYQEGELVDAEITSVVDFGAFARVPFDIEGLIHISEIGIPANVAIESYLSEGTEVLARIIGIEAEDERLALSLRRVTEEETIEWMNRRDKAVSD